MAKVKISDYDSSANNNTDVASVNIDEGCAPSGINNAIRAVMAHLKDFQQGTNGDSFNGPVNGTIGATTPAAGTFTTLSTTGNTTLGNDAGDVITINGTTTFNQSVAISSGSFNGAIGSTTPSTASVTTLSASGAVTLSGGTANGVAYLNGFKVLTTGSALTFDGTNLSGGGNAAFTGYFKSGANMFLGQGSYVSGSYATSDLVLWNNTTGVTAFLLNGAEQMRLTSTGLGIGTSSPGAKLDVVTGANNRLRVSETSSTLYFDSLNATASAWAPQYSRATTFSWLTAASGTPSVALTLDSSGNLGLGVTPSAWYSFSKVLQVGQSGALETRSNANVTALSTNQYINSSGNYTYLTTDYATRYYQTNGQHIWQVAASGTAGNAITFTQAMTLDASGNLGLGTTSPSSVANYGAFTVNGTNGGLLDLKYGNSLAGRIVGSSGSLSIEVGGTSYFNIYTNGSERARIDSSGNLLVGTTSANPVGARNNGVSASATRLGFRVPAGNNDWGISSSSGVIAYLYSDNGVVVYAGSIAVNGNTASYNSVSDYRLKTDVQPMTGALAKVAALKPCTYKWNADGSDGEGFIAHELAEVVPQCVTGEKDAVDAEGKPVYQGIDTSFLVATLTAAIQEQQAQIEQLRAEINTLKGN